MLESRFFCSKGTENDEATNPASLIRIAINTKVITFDNGIFFLKMWSFKDYSLYYLNIIF